MSQTQAKREMDVVTMNIIESTLLSICREMGVLPPYN